MKYTSWFLIKKVIQMYSQIFSQELNIYLWKCKFIIVYFRQFLNKKNSLLETKPSCKAFFNW